MELQVRLPEPFVPVQAACAFGVQALTTQTPFCKLNPALQALIWHAPKPVPPALQILIPVPLLSAQVACEFGVQAFAIQLPFCKLNPELHELKTQAP